MTTNQNNYAPEDPDFDDWDDNDDPVEPDYWECLSCGKAHGKKPMGLRCDRCDSIVEEGYF